MRKVSSREEIVQQRVKVADAKNTIVCPPFFILFPLFDCTSATMLIKEYRIVMPFTIEEYQIGQTSPSKAKVCSMAASRPDNLRTRFTI
ncbi:hypothetical protein niasHT_009525 [Heterodera trifolii]|uniref:Phosphatidylinositol transfer protein N-terminal domain-containing protein n=1 Tax=Heterodera trifolii TaxID=157864 RepID=A0ABD2LQ81_9BILA